MNLRLTKSKYDLETSTRIMDNAEKLYEEVQAMLDDLEDFFPNESLISGSDDEAKETVVAVRKRIALINKPQPAQDRAGKE